MKYENSTVFGFFYVLVWTLFHLCLVLLFLRTSRTFPFLLMIVLDNQRDPFFNSIISSVNYIFHFSQVPGLDLKVFNRPWVQRDKDQIWTQVEAQRSWFMSEDISCTTKLLLSKLVIDEDKTACPSWQNYSSCFVLALQLLSSLTVFVMIVFRFLPFVLAHNN